MKKMILLLLATAGSFLSRAQQLNISTGLGNPNTNETNWKVGTSIPASGTPYIKNLAPSIWEPDPVAGTNARWIIPSPNWGSGQTVYFYERSFNVAPGKRWLRFNFRIAADDVLQAVEIVQPGGAARAVPFTVGGPYRFTREILDSIACPVEGVWKIRVKVFCADRAGQGMATGLLVSGQVTLVDKLSAETTQEGCCFPAIKGTSVVCDEQTPTVYTLTGANLQNVSWLLPPGVVGTINQVTKQLTITSWGPVTSTPTVKILRLQLTCGCDVFTTTIPVTIYPKRTPTINASISSNGAMVNTITVSGDSGPAGTINMMYLEKWNYTSGGGSSSGLKLRHIYWMGPLTTAAAPMNFTWYGNAANTNNGTPPAANSGYDLTTSGQWQNLPANNFYLAVHGQYFENNTCGWTQQSRVLFVSSQMILLPGGNQSTIIDLGAPGSPELKQKIKELEQNETFKKLAIRPLELRN